MKWIWNRCRHRKAVSLLAAGVLGEREKTVLENHMATCRECQTYHGEIKTLTSPLTGWEKELSHIESTPFAQRRWARAVQDLGSGVPPQKSLWQIVWHELIRPNRRTWVGMAALWVAMLVVNAQLSERHDGDVGARASSSQDVIQAWVEENRVLAELTQPAIVAPAPTTTAPRPRSQRALDWKIL